jgi:tetratricopeptide (TPR) repeat protein
MSRRRPKLLAALVLVVGIGVGAYFILAPDADLKAADAAVARRDFRKAAEHLDRYLRRHPDNLDARLLAARTARRAGDFAAAVAHLEYAGQQPGPNPAVVLESRLIAAQRGDLEKIESLMAAHVDGPRSPETPLVAEAVAVGVLAVLSPVPGSGTPIGSRGDALLPVGRRAAEVWLELRTGREDRAAGLVWRGRLRQLAGDHPGGVADLRAALALEPESFDARFRLALSIAQSEPGEMAEHLAVLRRRHPNDPHVWFGLAAAYRMIGRVEDAAAILDEALAANPNDRDTLVERGNLAVDAGRAEEAERLLLRALELAPNAPETHLALSRCMQLTGRADKVKEYLDRFRQLDAERKPPTGPPPKP